MRRHRWGVAMVVLVLSLVMVSACATMTVTKTAETLTVLGTEFLSTAAQIDAAYQAKLIPETDYAKWRTFVPPFKKSFAEAEQALITLRNAGTAATPEQQAALVRALKDQLLRIVLEVYAPAAKGVQP